MLSVVYNDEQISFNPFDDEKYRKLILRSVNGFNFVYNIQRESEFLVSEGGAYDSANITPAGNWTYTEIMDKIILDLNASGVLTGVYSWVIDTTGRVTLSSTVAYKIYNTQQAAWYSNVYNEDLDKRLKFRGATYLTLQTSHTSSEPIEVAKSFVEMRISNTNSKGVQIIYSNGETLTKQYKSFNITLPPYGEEIDYENHNDSLSSLTFEQDRVFDNITISFFSQWGEAIIFNNDVRVEFDLI